MTTYWTRFASTRPTAPIAAVYREDAGWWSVWDANVPGWVPCGPALAAPRARDSVGGDMLTDRVTEDEAMAAARGLVRK